MTYLTIHEVNKIIFEKLGNRNRFSSTEFEVKKMKDLFLIFQIFSLSSNDKANYFIDFSKVTNAYVQLKVNGEKEIFRLPRFIIEKRSDY